MDAYVRVEEVEVELKKLCEERDDARADRQVCRETITELRNELKKLRRESGTDLIDFAKPLIDYDATAGVEEMVIPGSVLDGNLISNASVDAEYIKRGYKPPSTDAEHARAGVAAVSAQQGSAWKPELEPYFKLGIDYNMAAKMLNERQGRPGKGAEPKVGDWVHVCNKGCPKPCPAALERELAQASRNTDYYRGLLDEIASHLGPVAFVSDDGSVQDEPVRAKLPELVAKGEAKLRAVIAKLPKCEYTGCDKTALWMKPGTPDMDTGERSEPMPLCDEHKGEGCGRPNCCDPEELPYAAEIRALGRRPYEAPMIKELGVVSSIYMNGKKHRIPSRVIRTGDDLEFVFEIQELELINEPGAKAMMKDFLKTWPEVAKVVRPDRNRQFGEIAEEIVKLYAGEAQKKAIVMALCDTQRAGHEREKKLENGIRNLVARIDGDGGQRQWQDGSLDVTLARADALVVELLTETKNTQDTFLNEIEASRAETEKWKNSRDHYKQCWDQACEHVAEAVELLGLNTKGLAPDTWTLRDQCAVAGKTLKDLPHERATHERLYRLAIQYGSEKRGECEALEKKLEEMQKPGWGG